MLHTFWGMIGAGAACFVCGYAFRGWIHGKLVAASAEAAAAAHKVAGAVDSAAKKL